MIAWRAAPIRSFVGGKRRFKYADVKIVGYDATPEQISALKDHRQIICSYAQYPYVMGTTAIESIKTLLNGGSVEAVIRTGGGIVDYDNAEQFEKDNAD